MTPSDVMPADTTAWQRYRATGSDDAFREVVERHINLVYSVAVRRAHGDSALAEDITQQVFTDLSRKAAGLPAATVLAGWLYRHASFVAATLVRGESRRRHRELAAMNPSESDDSVHWEQIRPVLDDALGELPERDRNAIVLRFLDQQSFAQVGLALGIGSDAARMRVDRALVRLRDGLARRGIKSTAAALALGMGQYGVVAAPASLASAIAVAAASTLTVSTLATTATLTLMNPAKISLGLAALVAASSTTVAYLGHRDAANLRTQLADARADLASHVLAVEQAGGPESAELKALREDRVRLMALRDEITRLREDQRRLAALEAENQALRANAASRAVTPRSDGDGNTQRDLEAELQKGLGLARLSFARDWMLAIIRYSEDHQGQLPATFSQAASYYGNNNDEGGGLIDPDRFEIVHQGAWSRIVNPAATIVIREREPFRMRKPDGTEALARTYGFADGHSEIHASPTGDFESWERQRMAAPAAAAE